MSEYTQGVCQDGAAILRDGKPLTIEEILDGLRQADELAEALEHALKYQGMYCHEAYHGRKRANRILADYRKSKGE